MSTTIIVLLAAWLGLNVVFVVMRFYVTADRDSRAKADIIGYANNYLIDVKFGVIVDVEASRAIRQAEVGAAKTMIERTEERFGLKPERLSSRHNGRGS
jgi:hypothetical protein